MTYIFNSRVQTLTIALKPSSRVFVGAEVIRTPGLKARFERGLFKTEDEEAATLLRKLIESGQEKEVVELTNLDDLFYKSKKARNQRSAVTASEDSKALNPTVVREKDPEKAIKCVICGKEFKNQRDLNMHLVAHRPGVKVGEEKLPSELTVALEADSLDLEK